MYELVEPRVRRIVADQLGVGVEELAPEVSLTDDLAADSLDLVEVALALESEFDLAVPEQILAEVRTYADLVGATLELTRQRRRLDARRAEVPAVVRARIVSPAGENSTFERTATLTPYEAEEITEDALRAGRGARLELTVPPGTSDAGLVGVQEQFARLGPRGIQVSVRRELLSRTGAQPNAA
jgi:acyl carrier protein